MNRQTSAFKAIIIDDERPAREMLKAMIDENLPGIIETREATNGLEGIELIRSYRPDIIFLDIAMPNMTGLEMVRALEEEFNISIKVVFITAFANHAIEAFQMACLHYLIKPVKVPDLKIAFDRFRADYAANQLLERIKILEENLADQQNSKLSIRVTNGYIYVNPRKEILYLQADNNYTMIHLTSGKTHFQTKVLKYYEFLEPRNFYRIHQSYLVNMDFVRACLQEEPAPGKQRFFAVLSNGTKLPIARKRKRGFLARLSKNNIPPPKKRK